MTDKRVFELEDKFWEVWTDGGLESIDLRHNVLTAAGVKRVSAALPNAIVTSQDKSSSGPDFYFRFIAAME